MPRMGKIEYTAQCWYNNRKVADGEQYIIYFYKERTHQYDEAGG